MLRGAVSAGFAIRDMQFAFLTSGERNGAFSTILREMDWLSPSLS